MRIISVFLLIAVTLFGCVSSQPHNNDAPVAHLVLIWLKDAGNAQDREQVITASKQLAAIDGVIQVKVGPTLISDRDVVDDSYDVGLYVELASAEALENYVVDPLHKRIVREQLAPVIDRYIAYDFAIK